MVFLFNRTMKNILSNYIPHEIIIYDGRDLPWVNKRGSYLLMNENKDPKLLNKVEYFQDELKFLIEANKEKYYSSISK